MFWFRARQLNTRLPSQLLDLRTSTILERTLAEDVARKRSSAFNEQCAGTDQTGKALFDDQTTNRDNRRRIGGKSRASEFGKVQAIVNTMESIGAFWKTLP